MKLPKLNDVPAKLSPLIRGARQYVVVIFVIVVSVLYAFLIVRTNQLAQSEPSDEAVTEKLKATPRPKIDQATANKLEQLEDQNVQVKTLFNNARSNPFSE